VVHDHANPRSDEPARPDPIGGKGKLVEADETVIGGKKRNRAFAKRAPKKHSVMTLVERDGHSYSFHIANVTAKSLRPLIVKIVSRHSRLMTDEGKWYIRLGEEFASHETVNHAQDEYVRGDVYTNTAECRFSLMKRAVYGTHHSVSDAHLPRLVRNAAPRPHWGTANRSWPRFVLDIALCPFANNAQFKRKPPLPWQ
jgi:transposase-like protein